MRVLYPASFCDTLFPQVLIRPPQASDSLDCRNIKWIGRILRFTSRFCADDWAEQPYLLSLGMSKSLLAFVWIAGPLSGTLVQPYVGIMSDNCRVSWGKRKPFMIAGAAATIISLAALAWAREIVSSILGVFGADAASHGVKIAAITFAIMFVYILDFAINTGKEGGCFPPERRRQLTNSM